MEDSFKYQFSYSEGTTQMILYCKESDKIVKCYSLLHIKDDNFSDPPIFGGHAHEGVHAHLPLENMTFHITKFVIKMAFLNVVLQCWSHLKGLYY